MGSNSRSLRAFLKTPLVVAALVAFLCALLTLLEPLDHIFWNTRFRFGQTAASPSIIVVQVDESNRGNGKNWTSSDDAHLLSVLREQLPSRIYLDRPLGNDVDPALRDELIALGDKVTIVARFSRPDTFDASAIQIPNRASIGNASVVVSGWMTNFLGFGVYSACAVKLGGKAYPSFGPDLARRKCGVGGYFFPDFTLDPRSIPSLPAQQLIEGRMAPGLLTGRTVIISSAKTENRFGYFGHGRIDPVAFDIAGAEGLRSGFSMSVDWLPNLIFFVGVALMASCVRERRRRWAAYGAVTAITIFGPVVLQLLGIYSNPSASIMAALVFGGLKVWSKWRRRVLQTSASGLPNFMALSVQDIPEGSDVIVATISRYEEFLATLPSELHSECARQIARRFSVGSGTAEIFHGEGGHFAWIENARPADLQSEHFEGMRALFAAPLLVGDHVFDTNVHFGLDRNYALDTLTRVNTALSSASDAMKAGRTIEQFEAKRLADAPWELSLMARIDEGLRNGDIWLAYQPQWDYREMQISGAEALIRWNDPSRGPIRPDEFILQAEQAGRIDALTFWVLDQAISAAQSFNELGPKFQMSVNLSAQLVDKPSLVSSIAEIVRSRGMDCGLLTFEVTETASVYNRPAAVQNLQQLRAMGFRLSIDDFGTGEASLCYLADLPSDELKLDRRFVSRITTSDRDKQIVLSTINLAHALNQSVVAEGIEDRKTFEALRQMGCDAGQGYYVGRPETLEQLKARYAAMGKTRGKLFQTY
jgi:EAL domain-containing protein (putative c-di-GMP-specific phosphodiesterase class I)